MKNLAISLRGLKFLSATLVFIGVSASAQDMSVSHQLVRDTAESYVAAQLNIPSGGDAHTQIEMSALDSRIFVPTCGQPLQAQSSDNSLSQANVTVKVFCPDSNWFLYVMVRVSQLQDVVVASAAVSPGTLLDANLLHVTKLEKNQLRSTTFSSLEEVMGARSKRRLRAGQPIEPNQLCYVCKGDTILINASMGGRLIKASGIAQQDGNLGDTIMVRNQSSNKIIDARVISPALVSVNI
jgi:flagellar basal body P-ring formation protein FlgA